MLVRNEGTIVLFVPSNGAEYDWIDKTLVTEDWQWQAGALCVDHRMAFAILDVLNLDGIPIEIEERNPGGLP